jgi:hypothetical protein
LFEARWWRDYDGHVLRRSLNRVADPKAPILHRLQMAVIALIAADNRQQRDDADGIIKLVESIDTTTPREHIERLRARTVYHTAFGDIDVAVNAGKTLVETERISAAGASLMRALRWQSTPLKLSNDKVGAIDALKESYRLASRLDLLPEMWQASLYVQDVAIDCEDLDLALEWGATGSRIAQELTVRGPRSSNSVYLESRIALMAGDLDRARDLLDYAQTTDSAIVRTRAEESLLALDVHLRLRLGMKVPRSLLMRLRTLHLRTRGCGVRDFETGVLISASALVGELQDARELYQAYFRARRNRLRPHSALLEAGDTIA